MITFWSKNRCKDMENNLKLQINVTFIALKLHKNVTFAMRKLHKCANGAQHKYYVSVISICQCPLAFSGSLTAILCLRAG